MNDIPTPVTDAIVESRNYEDLLDVSRRFEKEAWTWKVLCDLNKERIIEQNARLKKYESILSEIQTACKKA